MKQYGYTPRCMEKEEKWYPEEQQEQQEQGMECGCECNERPSNDRCKVVVEPTVYCKKEKSYRHSVKHIVPVVCKEIEHHHYDHEYVIEKKVVKEKNRYDHGRRNEDWCKLANCENDRRDDCDCE